MSLFGRYSASGLQNPTEKPWRVDLAPQTASWVVVMQTFASHCSTEQENPFGSQHINQKWWWLRRMLIQLIKKTRSISFEFDWVAVIQVYCAHESVISLLEQTLVEFSPGISLKENKHKFSGVCWAGEIHLMGIYKTKLSTFRQESSPSITLTESFLLSSSALLVLSSSSCLKLFLPSPAPHQRAFESDFGNYILNFETISHRKLSAPWKFLCRNFLLASTSTLSIIYMPAKVYCLIISSKPFVLFSLWLCCFVESFSLLVIFSFRGFLRKFSGEKGWKVFLDEKMVCEVGFSH